jgi:putative oxidoreductase
MASPRRWALIAGAGELGAGALTPMGLLYPLAPLTMLPPMSVAIGKVHRGKPVWATEGGAELPLLYMAAGTALALTGPGRYSLDERVGLSLPAAAIATGGIAVAATAALALSSRAAATSPAGAGEQVGTPTAAEEAALAAT